MCIDKYKEQEMNNNKLDQDYESNYSYSRDSGRYDRVDFTWSKHSMDLSDGLGRVDLLPWPKDHELNYERLEDIIWSMKYASWNTLSGYGKPIETPVDYISEGAWVTPRAMSLSERDGDYE